MNKKIGLGIGMVALSVWTLAQIPTGSQNSTGALQPPANWVAQPTIAPVSLFVPPATHPMIGAGPSNAHGPKKESFQVNGVTITAWSEPISKRVPSPEKWLAQYVNSQIDSFGGNLSSSKIDHHLLLKNAPAARASLQFRQGSVSNTDTLLCFVHEKELVIVEVQYPTDNPSAAATAKSVLDSVNTKE